MGHEVGRVMKLVHAADLHIDSPLTGLARYEGAPVEQIRAATRRATENLVQLCVDQQASVLLLAGDLFDGDWKDYTTGLFFVQQMLRLKHAGVEVVLVRGNHDAASIVTKHLQLPDNVHQLSSEQPETKLFEELGIAVHGQSYARRAETDNIAANYPAAVPGCLNVGLLHTCVTGRPGHENYAPCGLDTLLAKDYDYWALGHIHEREVLHQTPWIVFPGNLQGRHIQETGSKGATLIEASDGKITRVEHQPLDVVRFWMCELVATTTQDADAVVDAVYARLEAEAARLAPRLLACRVRVSGSCAAHRSFQLEPERWEAEFRARAAEIENIWLHSVQLRTQPTADALALLQRGDAIGQIARRLAELRAPDADLSELSALFDELRVKLPAAGSEQSGSALDSKAALDDTLEDVQGLLLTRLLELHESG